VTAAEGLTGAGPAEEWVADGWTGHCTRDQADGMAAGGVQKIFVDYSLIGIDQRRFHTRVQAAIRRQLRPRDTVVVHGDDVASAAARVLSVAADDPAVELEQLDGQPT